MNNLEIELKNMSVEGKLYRDIPDKPDRIECYACAHYCSIKEGKSGICKVRYNKNGKLMVPHGYVSALNGDPIEKKPFYHAYPNTLAMSFGMLGCDFKCSFCFSGDTYVVTGKGPKRLQDLFESGKITKTDDGEISRVGNLTAISSAGHLRKVKGVFKHPYKGNIIILKSLYLPKLKLTPGHKVYATTDVNEDPRLTKANDLTKNHFLVIPKNYNFSSTQVINVVDLLQDRLVTHKVSRRIPQKDQQYILEQYKQGKTSREIGLKLGKDPSFIRHVKSRINRGLGKSQYTSNIKLEGEFARFKGEQKPGIPNKIVIDIELARLFGLYCAEGCVIKNKTRPNSYILQLSFGKKEEKFAIETQGLIKKKFGLKASIRTRDTTISTSLGKSSLCMMFSELMGANGKLKKVPEMLFDAKKEIVQSFIEGYLDGDGHRYENGKCSTSTVSSELAFGIAWLLLKTGNLPSIYENEMKEQKIIEGRVVNQQKILYNVVWYQPSTKIERKFKESEKYYFIPIKHIKSEIYDGSVYNMEVDDEHNYLANFLLVSNCQNWDISQTLRDPDAVRGFRKVTAQEIIEYAKEFDCRSVVSTYNEPLITSEWAVEVFKEAKKNGFVTGYVSNGNSTPEVLDYIQPYTDLYKIDLKSFSEKNYQAMGGNLSKVLKSIENVYKRGFWMELVTLLIPGFNNSTEEITQMAEFISELSVDIPWHITAYRKHYKMQDKEDTTPEHLLEAAEIAVKAGINYVYPGNVHGRVGDWENTNCPNCKTVLVERVGFRVISYNLSDEGTCPNCGDRIPGHWETPKERKSLFRFLT